MDDGLGVCSTFADCCSQSLAVKSDLFRAGFVANTQKSIWAPVQSLRWLGYRWDLKHNLLTVPEDKIDKLLVSIDYALSQSSLPARQLASVTGSIISNMLVFGNVCKLMTKSLHRALDRRVGWESRVDLDHAARKELEFWKDNVSLLNSRCFADAVRRPSRIVYSDTSAVGCAAFIAIDDMPVSHKNWDSLQMKHSSLFVENDKDVYLHGENNSTLFGSGNFSTPVFFLLLDGTVQYSVQYSVQFILFKRCHVAILPGHVFRGTACSPRFGHE